MMFEAADVKSMQTPLHDSSCSAPAISLQPHTQAKAAPTAEAGVNAAEEPKPVHLSVHGPTYLV